MKISTRYILKLAPEKVVKEFVDKQAVFFFVAFLLTQGFGDIRAQGVFVDVKTEAFRGGFIGADNSVKQKVAVDKGGENHFNIGKFQRAARGQTQFRAADEIELVGHAGNRIHLVIIQKADFVIFAAAAAGAAGEVKLAGDDAAVVLEVDGKADFDDFFNFRGGFGGGSFVVRVDELLGFVVKDFQFAVSQNQLDIGLRAAAEHAGNDRIRRGDVVGAGTDVNVVTDGGHQRRGFRFGDVCGDVAVAVFVAADDVVADFVVAGNGAAGNGVFKPAQIAVDVGHFDFGLGDVADVHVARTFDAPDNDAALGIAETGNAFSEVFAVVAGQGGDVFADAGCGLFEVEKQLFGLTVDDEVIKGVFPKVNQFLKNIFRA